MNITVNKSWWDELVRHVRNIETNREKMSEYGVLVECGNICIAASAVVSGATVFNEAKGTNDPFVAGDSESKTMEG